MSHAIEIIATTISGSISDWGKIKRIVPLFKEHGVRNVTIHALDSHSAARLKTSELVRLGSRILISAGGSGTFNAVMEGCHYADVPLDDLRLGFLRKGSADLIGKVLHMQDDIEEAIRVFVRSIREDRFLPCDVIQASSTCKTVKPRRFVGYGGAEIFGEIHYVTENRYMKYYKGILSQFFGDLGPFFVGTNLTILKRLFRKQKRAWEIWVDRELVTEGQFQSIIIVNGDLWPHLPFARNVPLGSGDFHVFGIRDFGLIQLPAQLRKAWNCTIQNEPEKYGFESFRVRQKLELRLCDRGPFPLNVDGSILECRGEACCEIMGQINLICA